MKRLLSLLTAGAALLLAAVSCQVAESDRTAMDQQTITINASLEDDGIIAVDGEEIVPETKTARQSDGSVWWTPGDQISLFYHSGDKGGSRFTCTAENPAALTQFRGTIDVISGGGESGVDNYYFWGVYPFDYQNSCDGTSVQMRIPTVQRSAENTFAPGQWPTIGKSLGLAMSFKNVACGYKFKVETPGIQSVTFSTGDPARQLTGGLEVGMDSKGIPVIKTVYGNYDRVNVLPADGLTFKPGVYYYATMIPGNFAGGVDMEFETGGMHAVYHCKVTGDKPDYPSGRGKFKVMDNKDHGLIWEPFIYSGFLPSGSVFHDALEKCGAPINSTTGVIEADAIYFEAVATPVGTNVAPSGSPVCVSYDSATGIIHVQSQASVLIANEDSSELLSSLGVTEIGGLNKIDFSRTKDFSYLFAYCPNMDWFDVSDMNTVSATTMEGMFDGCTALSHIDMSNFVVTQSTNLRSMFRNCSNLESVIFGEYFEFNSPSMCFSLFGEDNGVNDTRAGRADTDGDGIFITVDCTSEQATGLLQNAMVRSEWVHHRLPALAFSVSEYTKVYLATSNTYYNGSKFVFESTPYSFASKWSASHVSHFYWSKTPGVACSLGYSDSGESSTDVLFTNATETTVNPDFTAGGMTGIWRVLSKSEMTYLFSRDVPYCFATATVANVPGLILFPDLFVKPSDVTIKGLNNDKNPVTANSYDEATWGKLSNAGAIFLPLTGRRVYDEIRDTGDSCFYWTSTCEGTLYAYPFSFNTVNGIFTDPYSGRSDSYALHLVRDFK